MRPAAASAKPELNAFDIDGDSVADGFCSYLIQSGHSNYGETWQLYSNTLLIDNLYFAGALPLIRQDPRATEPSHFANNIVVQQRAGRPVYGRTQYVSFSAPGGGCAEQPTGLQVSDGNLFWRAGGEQVAALCPTADCCGDEELSALSSAAEAGPLFFEMQAPSATRSFATLAHLKCGSAIGGPLDLASLSTCGYDLDCGDCDGPAPRSNEGASVFADPELSARSRYRPARPLERRVGPPADSAWPESDWPWLGARPPQIGEDCVGFDPEGVEVQEFGDRYRLVEGSHAIKVFDERSEAERAVAVLRRYRAEQRCFVGRPGPSLAYLLTRGRSPIGSLEGELCTAVDADGTTIDRVGERWQLASGETVLDRFPDRQEAETAAEILRTHRFRYHCTIGGPNEPSFEYFRR